MTKRKKGNDARKVEQAEMKNGEREKESRKVLMSLQEKLSVRSGRWFKKKREGEQGREENRNEDGGELDMEGATTQTGTGTTSKRKSESKRVERGTRTRAKSKTKNLKHNQKPKQNQKRKSQKQKSKAVQGGGERDRG